MILMFSFLAIRTEKLANGTDPFFSSTTLSQDNEIDLLELGFAFAIENIDPSIGTIFAFHSDWLPGGGRNNKVETPIELVDCKEL